VACGNLHKVGSVSMKSLTFRFLMQALPSSAATLALLGLVGIASPARADMLCPSSAAKGGDGSGTFTNVSGPLDSTCGTDSAVTMSIPNQTGYAKLTWDPTVAGYPAGLTLGNLLSINAVINGQTGDDPFYMLAFTDNNDPFLDTTNGDQILLIEFQPTTVSNGGLAMAVDPNSTLFNLYDNTIGCYLLPSGGCNSSGQQDANSLATWFSQDSSLAGDALQQVRIGIGMAGGSGPGVSVTVDSLDIEGGPAAVPEPTSLLLLLTVVGATGLGIQRKQARSRRS
jgi:hypothetical protein